MLPFIHKFAIFAIFLEILIYLLFSYFALRFLFQYDIFMSTNETDLSPDSGEETDEGGDIQAIGENLFENQNWRILKLKNDIYRFLVGAFRRKTQTIVVTSFFLRPTN